MRKRLELGRKRPLSPWGVGRAGSCVGVGLAEANYTGTETGFPIRVPLETAP